MRRPTFLYFSPMDQPSPREERAMEVARRFNSLYRQHPNSFSYMTPSRVWARWEERCVES